MMRSQSYRTGETISLKGLHNKELNLLSGRKSLTVESPTELDTKLTIKQTTWTV